MPWYVVTSFVALMAVSIYHSFKSVQNLAEGPGNTLGHVFALGVFAKKERFTAEGWRHRRLASVFQLLAIVSALALWIVSGTLF